MKDPSCFALGPTLARFKSVESSQPFRQSRFMNIPISTTGWSFNSHSSALSSTTRTTTQKRRGSPLSSSPTRVVTSKADRNFPHAKGARISSGGEHRDTMYPRNLGLDIEAAVRESAAGPLAAALSTPLPTGHIVARPLRLPCTVLEAYHRNAGKQQKLRLRSLCLVILWF